MAEETDQTVEIDDKEMFQAAVSDEKPEPEQTQEERARDEKGRFVKQEAQPEAKQPEIQPPVQEETPPPQAEVKDEANVPSWRLREVNEARAAAEARAEQAARERYQFEAELRQMREQLANLNKPKQEPVDFFADPDKALQQHISPIEKRFEQFVQDMTLRTSRVAAIAQHGASEVAEMEAEIQRAMDTRNPEMQMLAMQMRASDDPAGMAMSWYKNQKLQKVTGGDPEKYKATVLDEALKDPEFLRKALELAQAQAGANQGRPVVKMPPSLNKVTNAGPSHTADDGDMSDRGLFKHAVGSPRR